MASLALSSVATPITAPVTARTFELRQEVALTYFQEGPTPAILQQGARLLAPLNDWTLGAAHFPMTRLFGPMAGRVFFECAQAFRISLPTEPFIPFSQRPRVEQTACRVLLAGAAFLTAMLRHAHIGSRYGFSTHDIAIEDMPYGSSRTGFHHDSGFIRGLLNVQGPGTRFLLRGNRIQRLPVGWLLLLSGLRLKKTVIPTWHAAPKGSAPRRLTIMDFDSLGQEKRFKIELRSTRENGPYCVDTLARGDSIETVR